jgi:glucose/mannose-6-phosphate isomerase
MNTAPYVKHIKEFGRQLSFEHIETHYLDRLRQGPVPEEIVVCGMGGSGLSGKILQLLSKELGITARITAYKEYGIPEHTNKNALFIFSSFSGETEETLSGIARALRGKKRVAVVTTGGILKKIAEKNRIPYALFPDDGLTPREALGYNLYSVLSLLRGYFPKIAAASLSSCVFPRSLETQGKILAEKIKGKISLLYAENTFSGILDVWKINLNETAKQYAFINYIPEMNHNEIVVAGTTRHMVAIFLEDRNASAIIQKRIRLSKKIYTAEKIPTITVPLSGRTLHERVWRSVILSHWISFFIAQKRNMDPSRTERLEKFKKKLRT